MSLNKLDFSLKGYDESFFMVKRLLEEGLAAKGVPIYSVNFEDPKEKELHVSIIIYLPKHTGTTKDFLAEQFDVKKGHLEEGGCEKRPIKIPAKLKRKRQNLPEWQNLKGKTIVFTVDTILNHSFHLLLSSTEKTSLDDSVIASMKEQISSIEHFFNNKSYVTPKTSTVTDIPETTNEEEEEEEAPTLLSKEEVLDALSALPRSITKRWVELAEENLLTVTHTFQLEESWTKRLEPFLIKAGLASEEELTTFIETHLNNWKDLYEAFETARLQRLIPGDSLSLGELFCVLFCGFFISRQNQF